MSTLNALTLIMDMSELASYHKTSSRSELSNLQLTVGM